MNTQAEEAGQAQRPVVGISSCLLGEKVRYDGGHKHDALISSGLGEAFDFRPVCPEMAIGLGVPREPIHLVGDAGAPRVVGVHDPSLEVTAALQAHGRQIADELGGSLSGYIFKARSPSCGVAGVPVHTDPDGDVVDTGTGAYARALMERLPLLPVIEEEALRDAGSRDNFIERVFALDRWQRLCAQGITADALVRFHSAHKLAVMAHGTVQMRALGRLVAGIGQQPLTRIAEHYGRDFMAALSRPATRRRHTDVLMHLSGYLKRVLEDGQGRELRRVIEAYRLGEVPLATPLRLLQQYFRHDPHEFVARQVYLYPYAAEWKLRISPEM